MTRKLKSQLPESHFFVSGIGDYTSHEKTEEHSSHLVIIWLLQQAPIGSVAACHDRRSRERFASFSLTLLRRKPASNIWPLAGGQMGSLVRDAGTERLMSW
jgi:hypothetical protein